MHTLVEVLSVFIAALIKFLASKLTKQIKEVAYLNRISYSLGHDLVLCWIVLRMANWKVSL